MEGYSMGRDPTSCGGHFPKHIVCDLHLHVATTNENPVSCARPLFHYGASIFSVVEV